MDLVGSGALSHVYIQHPPFRCSIPETTGLFYDDGNKLLLSPASDQVLSWKIIPSIQHDPPNSDSISEGPVLSICYSLDGKVIAIQRSNSEIQFKNRETGETFSRRYRPESEFILGFFWTDCPICDIVVIKTSGLDLFTYEPEFNTLCLVEAKQLSVNWYVYTHESRLVLVASGMQCKVFSGFQFSSVGIVHLPKFEMTMTKSEANQKPVLAAEDIHIVTVYGRIYCLQVDRISGLLHLYKFYRDAVIHQIVEPSKEVALQLLESSHQNLQARKLGMNMLRQLSFHHEYVLLLVEDGYYLEALRYARKNKVTTVHPSTFLEAALPTNDSQHLAAVLRFFSDFIPGFKNTVGIATF